VTPNGDAIPERRTASLLTDPDTAESRDRTGDVEGERTAAGGAGTTLDRSGGAGQARETVELKPVEPPPLPRPEALVISDAERASEREARNQVSLDRRWTITPCGGIRKGRRLPEACSAHHLHVAVFSDFAEGGDKAVVRSLREKGLLRDGHVLTADMFVDGQAEADVEEVLGRRLYVESVNKTYALPVTRRLKAKKPTAAPNG
jgi:hypothetical protein